MRGKLVVIDGIDGAGKTTQIKLLSKKLKVKNIPFGIVSFPQYGKNEYADYIYDYLSGKFGKINPYDLAKYYAKDRLTFREQILNWLENGKLVIANRYISSSKAHLGAYLEEHQRKAFITWIDELEYAENNMPKEDLTILLNVDPKLGQKNSQKKNHPDLHEDNLSHLEKANQIFLKLSKQEKWVVIESMKNPPAGQSVGKMKSPGEIHQQVLKTLEGKFF